MRPRTIDMLIVVGLIAAALFVAVTLIGGGYHECDPYTNGGCR
jgi:hypothetical protein